ncbi:hypothetical protein [Mycobacteroides salmoniphilum]|uniref:hypothetical protein n=1 Tax=Mycobacteroides salmoniphilum TaxID=404941 RepID=UPI0010646D39|nr:hypothetical protein [Mycobacteroides salmoniphilum]TDZ94803.1 hypothetical protein CCUG62472_01617 [Mycobacteroides salmoniphilum]
MTEAYIGIKVYRYDNPIYDQFGTGAQWLILADGSLLVHDPNGTKQQLIDNPLVPPNPTPRTPRWFTYAPRDLERIEAVEPPSPDLRQMVDEALNRPR